MDILLALLLGGVIGLVAGGIGGAYWATGTIGRSLRREVEAGRIDRDTALRVADIRRA